MELSTTHELHPRTERAPSRGTAHVSQRYALIGELGGGGMSTVHLAHDRVTGRVVAVKRIADQAARVPGAAARFAREAGVVAQLRHPNIVETVAIERDGAMATAIVTEYVRGASLRDTLAASGALPIDRVVRVLRDVASALAYAHARHIVHRDVKPANILIESDTKRALLADFGIACESGAPADIGDGLTIGTPAYMAPEQIEGCSVDARADVYALCVVGWEMLAGRMPWAGAPLADVLHRQRYEPLPDLAQLRPDIPVYLLHAINGGLAKDPAMRWRDGAELLRALEPRPTPIELPLHTSVPLDATMRMETRAIQETRREGAGAHALDAAAVETNQRPGRMRLLATTFGTVAIALALGGLAPHLSHGSTASRPRIDPELDSMLTLAVMPDAPTTRSPASSTRHTQSATCFATDSGHTRHCVAPARRSAASRTRVRHHRR